MPAAPPPNLVNHPDTTPELPSRVVDYHGPQAPPPPAENQTPEPGAVYVRREAEPTILTPRRRRVRMPRTLRVALAPRHDRSPWFGGAVAVIVGGAIGWFSAGGLIPQEGEDPPARSTHDPNRRSRMSRSS